MASKIKIKRSAVAGKVPLTTDLELSELAVNTNDGRLYTKKNDGSESVVEIGGPDFGDRNITTTGTSTAASFIPTSSTAPANGVYLPAPNSVAISTNGTGRLFVDASGVVAIRRYQNTGAIVLSNAGGTEASPTALTATALVMNLVGQGYDGSSYRPVASVQAYNDGAVSSTSSPGYLALTTTPSGSTAVQERLRITSAGLVGIGTSSPGGRLDVQGGDVYLGKTVQGDIFFSDGNDTYVKGANNIFFQTPNGSNRITVKGDTGNVGIGTTSPAVSLDVQGSVRVRDGNGFQWDGTSAATDTKIWDAYADNTTGNTLRFRCLNDAFSSSNTWLQVNRTGAEPTAIILSTGTSEKARIDSSGRLLVGTSSASDSSLVQVAGSISDSAGNVRAIPQNAQTTSYTLVATDAGQHVRITTGSVFVPAGVFSPGDAITIYNDSTSSRTINQGVSVTLRRAGTAITGNRTLAQYGVATILCVASNTFVVVGAS